MMKRWDLCILLVFEVMTLIICHSFWVFFLFKTSNKYVEHFLLCTMPLSITKTFYGISKLKLNSATKCKNLGRRVEGDPKINHNRAGNESP